MSTPFKVGQRVRLLNRWEAYQTGTFEPGLLGTVATVDPAGSECVGTVRLDEHFEELDDWDNELQVFINSDDYPSSWADWEAI